MKKHMAKMLSLAMFCENANIQISETDKKIDRLKFQLKKAKRKKAKIKIQNKIDELLNRSSCEVRKLMGGKIEVEL